MGEIRFVNDFSYKPVGEDISALAIALNRDVEYLDEDDYKVELRTGAIHSTKGWLAWVDYYEKKPQRGWTDCNYYLRAQIDGQLAIDLTIETYNPYFGCFVAYIAWHDNTVVIVYIEKHCVYGAAIPLNGAVIRQEIGLLGACEFCVQDDILFSYNFGKLNRYEIPSWEKIGEMSIKEGIELGILEEVI